MLKHLSKIRVEFNPVGPRSASALEFLAQCTSSKVIQSNPKCEITVTRRRDQAPPRVFIQFANGKEEVLDGSKMSAGEIRSSILEQAEMMETEQLFREAGIQWPIVIPDCEAATSSKK